MGLVQIQASSEHECLYVSCKGYHSINVQIACNSHYNIFNLVVRWPGSTHDVRILRESVLYQDFEAGRINRKLSGYPVIPWLMTQIITLKTEKEQRMTPSTSSLGHLLSDTSVSASAGKLHNVHILQKIPQKL